MNTTLLIVYVIVVLLMGLWVIWDLVKKGWRRNKQDTAWLESGIIIEDDEDWEHYWKNIIRRRKMEYKTGDVIKITGKKRKKLEPTIELFLGFQATLDHVSSRYGEITRELWEVIKQEYPEITKKYSLKFHEYSLIITEEKEDKDA